MRIDSSTDSCSHRMIWLRYWKALTQHCVVKISTYLGTTVDSALIDLTVTATKTLSNVLYGCVGVTYEFVSNFLCINELISSLALNSLCFSLFTAGLHPATVCVLLS